MKKGFRGFTLAEVLVTLGIIGIVAAMTIPTLVSNYQKKEYVTGLKKAYSTIGQGFKLMMADAGVTQFDQTDLFYNNTHKNTEPRNSMINTTIKKYFKVLKSCKFRDFSCKISGYTNLGTTGTFNLADDGNGFYTADGMFIDLLRLNDSCPPNYNLSGRMKSFCGIVTVDINGAKKPNKRGRDLFDFAISHDGNLFPFAGTDETKYWCEVSPGDCPSGLENNDLYWRGNLAPLYCGTLGSNDVQNADGTGCSARIMEEGWEMNY